MRGAPLTVAEARSILRADEALDLTFDHRLATGTTFGDDEREAWIYLVESARARLVGWGLPSKALDVDPDPDAPYPGGNAPDFQTLALEAIASAPPKASSSAVSDEAHALRAGIETIVRAFGTPSAEWVEQLRGLLDRVPPGGRRS